MWFGTNCVSVGTVGMGTCVKLVAAVAHGTGDVRQEADLLDQREFVGRAIDVLPVLVGVGGQFRRLDPGDGVVKFLDVLASGQIAGHADDVVGDRAFKSVEYPGVLSLPKKLPPEATALDRLLRLARTSSQVSVSTAAILASSSMAVSLASQTFSFSLMWKAMIRRSGSPYFGLDFVESRLDLRDFGNVLAAAAMML